MGWTFLGSRPGRSSSLRGSSSSGPCSWTHTRSAAVPRAASSDRRLEGPATRVVLGLIVVCLVAGCFGGDSQKTVALGPAHELEFVDVASDVGLDFRQGAFRWSVT